MRTDKVTICVLLYGDHVELAARCLNSICAAMPDELPANLRVGLNDVSDATRQYVNQLIENRWLLRENVFDYGDNIHKYPMMRRMLTERPPATPYVMWFDDDSFVMDHMQGAQPDFLTRVLSVIERPDQPVQVGGVYTINLGGNQEAFIKAQPWYAGRTISTKGMRFVTGGWWTARLDFLRQHDYPWPGLDHRGGDVMFGALCQQQQVVIATFRDGVAINADSDGRESKAPRRGFDQQPLGFDFDPSSPPPEPPTPQEVSPAQSIHSLLDL